MEDKRQEKSKARERWKRERRMKKINMRRNTTCEEWIDKKVVQNKVYKIK